MFATKRLSKVRTIPVKEYALGTDKSIAEIQELLKVPISHFRFHFLSSDASSILPPTMNRISPALFSS